MRRCWILCWIVFACVLPLAAQQDAFPIQPGSIEGNINDAFFSTRYRVTLNAGQTAIFTMQSTSGDLDPFLLFFDASDRLLADNDDAEPGKRDSRIEFTAPEAGDYIIEATRFDQEDGSSSGTYRLTFTIQGSAQDQAASDPLQMRPSFGVAFQLLDYGDFAAGELNADEPRRYFVFGGRQGDFVRVVLTRSAGDLEPSFALFNAERAPVRHSVRSSDGTLSAYATLPVTGWYLIEVGAAAGAGGFTLYAERLTQATIQPGQTVQGELSAATPSIAYIFNATIGERIFSTLNISNPDSRAELLLVDVNETLITERLAIGAQARVRATIPRSGPYLLIARSATGTGPFELSLGSIPVDPEKLEATTITYNSRHKDALEADAPLHYYRFSGKAGELVTLELRADEGSPLDPYLILTDSTLSELASNDNAGATRNARISQVALPQDGTYYVLATRSGLAAGTTRGAYSLEITVGAIALNPGALMATLRWSGDADLNLFVRGPNGRTVSWANPAAGGGILQIDSNTRCETPSTQPVEHIYYPAAELLPGDYTIWIWHQQVCGRSDAVPVTFDLNVNGELVRSIRPEDGITLLPDQRMEITVRVTGEGEGLLANPGTITTPSSQQRASQGGDTLLVYGQSITGNLNDEIFARFYQFAGSAGDVVRIHAERLTGSLDPILVLRDADERNLMRNDDSDEATKDARLTYTLPQDGRYVIAVTRFGLRDGATNGDYRLTLERITETAASD